MIAALLFVVLALFGIYGAFELQEQMKECSRWRRVAWAILAVVLCWKAADAVLYGAPGFPSSDWFLLIALALFLTAGGQVRALGRLLDRLLHRLRGAR